MDKWLNGTEGATAEKIYTGERKKKKISPRIFERKTEIPSRDIIKPGFVSAFRQ